VKALVYIYNLGIFVSMIAIVNARDQGVEWGLTVAECPCTNLCVAANIVGVGEGTFIENSWGVEHQAFMEKTPLIIDLLLPGFDTIDHVFVL